MSKPAPETKIKNELQGALYVLLEEKDPLQFKISMNDLLSMRMRNPKTLGNIFRYITWTMQSCGPCAIGILNMPIPTLIVCGVLSPYSTFSMF